MTGSTTLTTAHSKTAHANGIDIHYLDVGSGRPLLLLHGGMVSTNPIWGSAPISYHSSLKTLAQQFRVIAPDTRGCGLTRHTSGTISMNLLADDTAALIEALRAIPAGSLRLQRGWSRGNHSRNTSSRFRRGNCE